MSLLVDAPGDTLAVIRSLCERLEDARIRYCHWKSTTGLARALAGRTDLDLLVDPAHAAAFREVVASLGFKPFISHPSRRYPGVEDHIGLDAASGRLVHLHVYQQLILGEHYVKNHVVPLEAAFLDDTSLRDGVRIPAPAVELAVLILRALLKYRDEDAAKDLLGLGRRGGLPPDIVAEVRDLAARTSVDEVVRVASRHVPSVPPEVFRGFLSVVAGNRRDALALLRLRRSVRRGLRPYRRAGTAATLPRYLAARLARFRPVRFVTRPLTRSQMRRKSPVKGGLTIAVIGPDGAGKSTVVDALQDWLGWRVNLRVLYLGTARPSVPVAGLQRLSRLARRAAPRSSAARLLAAVRYLAEARERAARVREGVRLAHDGVVVVFDRYPLPYLQLDDRSMDGARIGTLGAHGGPLRALGNAEARIYERLPHPDLVLALSLPAAVALARKASRDPLSLAAKATAVTNAASARTGGDVVAIDAARPLPEVLADVRAVVWARL